MTVRIGVIGTGFGSKVVAPAFDATDGCEVVEVVSARNDADVANLCDRVDLDLVTVHSPPWLHASHVRRALLAGHAVLCDKPFGLDASEAEALYGAAEAAECTHLVNFEFRCDPMRALVRDLVRDGAVGTPEHVSWTHLSAGSRVPMRPYGWLFDRGCGGGWIGAWGSHAIDTLRWVFGEVASARAQRRTLIAERLDGDGVGHACDAEDTFSASLTVGDGVTGSIDTTFAAAVNLAPRLVITGDEGVLECVADRRIVLRRRDGSREEHERPAPDGDPHTEPMRRWAAIVRNAVEDGEWGPDVPTFADGLACAKVLDALRA